MKAGTSIGDITGGMFTALGIASALYHREKTGAGMKVDVSMLDGQIAILESAVVRCTSSEQPRGDRQSSSEHRAVRAIRDRRSPADRGGRKRRDVRTPVCGIGSAGVAGRRAFREQSRPGAECGRAAGGAGGRPENPSGSE